MAGINLNHSDECSVCGGDCAETWPPAGNCPRHEPVGATRSTVMLVACIHCDREMATSQIHKHETVCIANPEIAELVKACLRGCSEGPFVPSRNTYDKERQCYGEDIPNSDTGMAGLGFAIWEDLAIWAGLRPRTERLAYTFEELRRVSAQNHDGRIGPGAREWDTEKVPGVYVTNRLLEMYGAWSKVLEAAGLVCESHGYYLRRTRERTRGVEADVDAYIAEAAAQAESAKDDYPALPGTWKVKTYALWPSGQQHTGYVYELR